MEIKIKRLSKKAILPKYAHKGDAGMDLFTAGEKILKSGEWYGFPLGFVMEIPEGYVGLVWDKSGLASKFGLHVLAGVIDSSYRGEIKIVVYNLGQKPYKFRKGDKVAQMVIQPILAAEFKVINKLSNTKRGGRGFGSTGR